MLSRSRALVEQHLAQKRSDSSSSRFFQLLYTKYEVPVLQRQRPTWARNRRKKNLARHAVHHTRFVHMAPGSPVDQRWLRVPQVQEYKAWCVRSRPTSTIREGGRGGRDEVGNGGQCFFRGSFRCRCRSGSAAVSMYHAVLIELFDCLSARDCIGVFLE